VLVVSHDAAGRLVGLLCLAARRGRDGQIIVAGGHQAEYQAWLCLPELGGLFPSAAFDAIRREFPDAAVKFKYLPSGLPLEWVKDESIASVSILKSHHRPLLRLGDGKEIRESLGKSGNKSRLRRLKKIGRVEFSRITDPAEFAPLLDEMIRQHDARQFAVHGTAPFADDATKRAFHQAMMQCAGLLHVTVLKVGEHIASAQLNVTRGRELQLYLISHSPFLARLSPGKIHMLFLGRMLVEEGYETLDLTPGGDAYKERFANAADEVHSLTVHPHAASKWVGLSRHAGRDLSRRMLNHFGSTPATARDTVHNFVTTNPCGNVLRCFRRGLDWVASQVETRVFAFDLARAQFDELPGVRRDSLEHLLAYRPSKGAPSRRQFISQAMKRLEEGHHAYTAVEDDRLLEVGWLAEESPEGVGSELLPGISLPPGSGRVIDLQTFAEGRGRGLATSVLCAMLNDARAAGLKRMYVAVRAKNAVASRFYENAGFVYQCSSHVETKLGRSRSWVAPMSALFQASMPADRDKTISLPYQPPRAA
jgi:CelD/BcsL family acetyltransferase involved in cellulose biosynthesis/GNAT superfamily N-acetyltransferase